MVSCAAASSSARVKIFPVGFTGVFSRMVRVRGVTAARMASTSPPVRLGQRHKNRIHAQRFKRVHVIAI